jgi:hypothetical protein
LAGNINSKWKDNTKQKLIFFQLKLRRISQLPQEPHVLKLNMITKKLENKINGDAISDNLEFSTHDE